MDLEKILEYSPKIVFGISSAVLLTSQVCMIVGQYRKHKAHLAYVAEKEREILAVRAEGEQDRTEVNDRLRLAAAAKALGDESGARIHKAAARVIYDRCKAQVLSGLTYFSSDQPKD
ncbi:MAG: hypothetical protein AABX70_08040 [Nanoarchaeota archaeon]